MKRKMYSVNGIRAIKIRVVNDRDEARVEAEVDEDDSEISSSSVRRFWTHLVNDM